MNAMQDKQHNVFLPNGLELRLKAERVQEPQSIQAEQEAAFLYELAVQPVQPVSIALSGTSVVLTLHGTGGAAPGGLAEAA